MPELARTSWVPRGSLAIWDGEAPVSGARLVFVCRRGAVDHPGEILKDTVIPAFGMNARSFALAIGVTPQTLHQLLKGSRPVSAAMALRLGKICGNGPDMWMNLQARWDLELARAALGPALDRIEARQAIEI